MNAIKRLFEIQDNFYSQFQIYFKGKRKHHSIYSMSLSFIANMVCFAMGLALLSELICHSKPTINTSKVESSYSENLTFNTKDLLYTIGFKDKNYNDITDPAIASIVPYYEKTLLVGDKLVVFHIKLAHVNCTSIYPLFESLGLAFNFNSTGLINNNCFDGSFINEEVILGGKYGTAFYGNLLFYLKKCINATESDIVCKSDEEIKDALQDGWIQLHYATSYIDYYNYTNPIQYTISDYYSKIDISLNKFVYHYFNELFFHSENNILFSNQNTNFAFKSEMTRSDINFAETDGIVYTIYVCPSLNIEHYYRRYIKIQEIGASLGGLWSLISLIIVILISFVQLKHFQENIINDLFDFTTNSYISPSDSLFVCNKNAQYFKKQKIEFPPTNIKYNYEADLGIKNLLKAFFMCSAHKKYNKHQYEYNLVMNELMKYIDFHHITRYFHDIEAMKEIFNDKKKSKGVLYDKFQVDVTDYTKLKLSTLFTVAKEASDSNVKIVGSNFDNLKISKTILKKVCYY